MFLGIDIGTQSLKAVVTDGALKRLGEASRAYAAEFPAPDRAEQSPSLWEGALGPAIAEALSRANVQSTDIKALGLAGQLDGCIPVNAHGEALGNCLIWMDRRAGSAMETVDRDTLRDRAGLVADPSHLAAKAKWLKRNLAAANAIRTFHQPVSYLVERLTGACVIDHALASTSMVYNLSDRAYDEALLSAFELSREELPSIAEAHEAAGALNARGASLTGLPAGTPVAVGTGDDFSTPLGAGIVEVDTLSVAIGTGEVVGCLFDRPKIDATSLVETHAYPAGSYFLENPGWLSGGAVKWLMDLLGVVSFDDFETLAGKAPAGAEGVIFLPALTGAMAPEWIAEARGCFFGLTAKHGREHLARALLEGCSFAMRDVIERLVALGAKPKAMNIIAGGSRSRLWAQIRADVMNMPARLAAEADASPMGAAMLASVAGGAMRNLRDACRCVPLPSAVIDPIPENTRVLDESYRRYRALFASLKPMFVDAKP
jgi:xylulokinase